jgi:lipopolysaccharide/colanic/teichoic acid biosynthesis glycosyltransferase
MFLSRKLRDSRTLLPETDFLGALCLERKRAERSRKPFVLMLMETSMLPANGRDEQLAERIAPAILGSVRETDIVGWHKERAVLGVIFAELGMADKCSVMTALRTRVRSMLQSALPEEDARRITVTFCCFPDDWDMGTEHPLEPLYPDLVKRNEAEEVSRTVKRAVDVFGSAMALTFSSPLLLAIAVAIKVASPGPVIFRQKRIGQHGVPFTLLKFRSMTAVNDPEIHKAFVTRLIAGDAVSSITAGNGQAVYKLTDDPRLTTIGRLLRKASLDELPQFFNVLRGEMSLVGPRPPLHYELEAYDVWHRRRLLEAKPGLTGLWQVNGRSRICFDDMVRLDLQYAKTWSLWLDLKILLKTPLAMFSGAGAY